jgi:hypothetical protein
VDRYIVWLDGVQRELIKARGSQDKSGFVYPEGPEGELGRLTKYSAVRVSVWRTGQTTGLLPRETAQFHTRLYVHARSAAPALVSAVTGSSPIAARAWARSVAIETR